MHYYGFNEHLEIIDFIDFADYVEYLYCLSNTVLTSIRRRLYRDKSVRRYVGNSPLFLKDDIIKSILSATDNLSLNKRNNFL